MDIPIVDEHDAIIGYKDRFAIDYDHDIYRVSSLWIQNSRGDVLLAQRAFDKVKDPGRWGPAVAGTVEKGESYEQNIYKEAAEEIGLTGITFTEGPKQRVRYARQFFNQWFLATVDQPATAFILQKEEVEQVKWMPLADLQEDVELHPESYITSMAATLKCIT